MSRGDLVRFPCCEHCAHESIGSGHYYECSPANCVTGLATAEAADRARFERVLVDRLDTFDEAELLRAFRHVAHDPAAMDAVNDALDAVERGDA